MFFFFFFFSSRRRHTRFDCDWSSDVCSSDLYRREDESLWLEVFGWLMRYHEHDPDWADGYLAVVSEKERGSRVWTYDREFRTTWRRPGGTRVPLAGSWGRRDPWGPGSGWGWT